MTDSFYPVADPLQARVRDKDYRSVSEAMFFGVGVRSLLSEGVAARGVRARVRVRVRDSA